MTPKEKAIELVGKYFNTNLEHSLYGVLSLEQSKVCALIAVDEILDLGYANKSDFKVYDFYSKVKIEIIKLKL